MQPIGHMWARMKGAPFKVLKLFPPQVLGARDIFFVDQNDGESNFQNVELELF